MLKLDQRPSGIWRIRGTVQGVRIDQSARTRCEEEASIIRHKLEADIFAGVHGLKKPEGGYTFADATERWLNAGREIRPFPYLEDIVRVMGEARLADLTQGRIDAFSFQVLPTQARATRKRHFYTPVGVILKFAAKERMMPYLPLDQPSGRTKKVPSIFTPQEFEILIKADPDMAATYTYLIGTGARASEAFGLDWKHVSQNSNRTTFWDTKGGLIRSVDLAPRTRAAMPERPAGGGAVFVSPETGQPWAKNKYDDRYYGPGTRMARVAKRLGWPRFGPHKFRHSWASWHYAVHKNIIQLQIEGAWADAKSVRNYVHLGSPDLREEVLKRGWFHG